MATKGDVSDLDEFIYGGEPVRPMLSGFARRRVSGISQSSAGGGLTRQRKKFYNQPYTVDATYRLDTVQMQDYVKIFFERNEGKRFIAYLRADRPLEDAYVVQVVSDWEDAYASAVDGTMTVTLEVVSCRDRELDAALFPLYQAGGDDVGEYVDGFRQIVLAIPEE